MSRLFPDRKFMPGCIGVDNVDVLKFSTLKTWQISELRRRLVELITDKIVR